MVKRLLAVALVLTLVFGFVACEDRNPTPPETPVVEPGDEREDIPTLPSGPPAQEPQVPPEPAQE